MEGEQMAKEKPKSTHPQGQVVSSLFTSNPVLPKTGNRDVTPQRTSQIVPSNAPLSDSSTFRDLGLDPLLVNHIKVKLSITKPTSIQRASLPVLLSSPDTRTAKHDVLIQSHTGSGKTLSYLLPVIQDLLPLSSLSYIDRSIGTLAIIVAPTRELAKQISDVLEQLLQMRLRSTEEIPDGEDDEPRRTRWLVSGLLTGGATRTHEKARLRKGIPILVSTPGRLLDHLQNTTSFNVGRCRWLILDEADRLMELGFEETITDILKGLEGRRSLAIRAVETGQGLDNIGGWEWRQRRTVLCSATIREDVQKLAGFALKDPIMIKGGDNRLQVTPGEESGAKQPETFTPPSQLSQKYVLTPLKLRLVTLIALLRFLLRSVPDNRQGIGAQIIVFFSCTDSVDFHWRLFGQAIMSTGDTKVANSDEAEDEDDSGDVEMTCTLLPSTKVYRLHGSLPLATRLASLQGFAGVRKNIDKGKGNKKEAKNSILFSTSVASRGLDLPFVRAVVQYDLPTEGGTTEYVHRVGRTARAGKGGEAWSIVCPSEADWVPWVEERMKGREAKSKTMINLEAVEVDSVLQQGFGGKGSAYEDRATQVQLALEHWVLKNAEVRVFIIGLTACHG
jgi:ATP-dependent RNA helicase DDX31/DBP7